MRNYYHILQVSPDAEQEVIEVAYRRLARKYHPDVYAGSDAGERMRDLNEAYGVLGDPGHRAKYDAELKGAEARAGAGARRPPQRPRSRRPPPPPTGLPARPARSAHEEHGPRRDGWQTGWAALVAGLLLAVGIAAGTTAAVTLSKSHKPQSQAEPDASFVAAAQPTVAPTPSSGSRAAWDYCRKVGTSSDMLGVEEGAPETQRGWALRCYHGRPLICNCGGTCGMCMKLIYNETEPEGLADWCRQNPHATYPPGYLSGHGSQAYSWQCADGGVVRKWNDFDPHNYDELGFPLGSWVEIPEPQDKEEPVPPPPPDSPFAQPPPCSDLGPPYNQSAYPDVCIPGGAVPPLPDQPDYDCEHIPFRNFRVLLPDPHGFDADGDGIGCEYP